MSRYIVTIKLPKNPKHDPHNKVTGPCPITWNWNCTDVTGEHHSFEWKCEDCSTVDEVCHHFDAEYHVTRVEQV